MQIEELRAQDKKLLQEFSERIKKRTSPPREIQAWLAETPEFTSARLEELGQLLTTHGTLDVVTLRMSWKEQDGTEHTSLLPRGTVTDMWPMGTNWWARDHSFVAARFLAASHTSLMYASTYGELGKELMLSALAIFATAPQLKRFWQVIKSQDETFVHQRENWPQVFLTIKDNLSGSRPEIWSHKQDAWQILAYLALTAVEEGDIALKDLAEKHKQFLGAVLPFLAKVQYWQEENSGSWEEIEARRSSVMAWDMAIIGKVAVFAQRPEGSFLKAGYEAAKQYLSAPYPSLDIFEASQLLIAEGKKALQERLPFESPDYEKTNARYRETDAALIYLLHLDIPRFLDQPTLEEQLLQHIERLTDVRTGAIRRYLDDSYQGKSFFRNEITFYLREIYGAPSGDASGVTQWLGRKRVVPKGSEAAWVHFVWQMSAWAGKRYHETGEKKYWDMQQAYFRRGLRLITGEGEVSIDVDSKNRSRVIDVPAWRIPEAYLTEESLQGEELIFPSPHTPLNWAVGEAIYAFAMMKKSLDRG